MTSIPKDWLRERAATTDEDALARDELRRLGMTEDEIHCARTSDAASRWSVKWQAFLSHMIPGDELWHFESPPETWQRFEGRRGFALVRDGQPVECILTFLN